MVIIMSEVKVWRSRITPSARGAIFRAKRWFYATYYAKKDDPVREESRQNWAQLARKLVEETNSRGVSDKASRLIIYYSDENGVFKPIRAEIEIYELKHIDTIKISA